MPTLDDYIAAEGTAGQVLVLLYPTTQGPLNGKEQAQWTTVVAALGGAGSITETSMDAAITELQDILIALGLATDDR
jgi:hypothetical protein